MASNQPEHPPPYSEAIKQPPYNLAQDGPAPKYSTHQQAQPPYPPPGKKLQIIYRLPTVGYK